MNNYAHTLTKSPTLNPPSSAPARTGLLPRQCACGGSPGPTGECIRCRRKRLLASPLQTKLRINQPGDRYEREADRMADVVMRRAEPGLQRKPT